MRNLAALLLFAYASLLSTVAVAQFLMPGVVIAGGAPACSNKLDFSVACNSQYINVVGL